MNPFPKITYLALSRAGTVVASFDTPDAGHRYLDDRAKLGVVLELVAETVTRRPCPRKAGQGAPVVTLSDRRAGGGRG